LVDVLADGSVYRGTIRPADRGDWFASYTAFIVHYADLASRSQVEELAVGTELAGMSADRAGWLGCDPGGPRRYSGPLVYAANFDEYAGVAFWDAVDLIGIDAYWQLSRAPTTDAGVLQGAWEPIVRSSRPSPRVAAAASCSPKPVTRPAGDRVGTLVVDHQRRARPGGAGRRLSGTVGQSHRQSWWAGVFWWAWDIPATDPTTNPLGYSPRGKAAEAVLRRWWT